MLPNIYHTGTVCWGGADVYGLADTYKFWESYFNYDYATKVSDKLSIKESLDSLGISYYYDKNDEDDDDDFSYDLTPQDLVHILSLGGKNSKADDAGEWDTILEIESCQQILKVHYSSTRPELTNLKDSDNYAESNLKYNVYLFLINEIEDDIWEAVLPSDQGEEYNQLLTVNLEELNDA